LKAIATSFSLLRQYPTVAMAEFAAHQPFWVDTTFYVALVLIVFAILFGTRHIDITERHEGMVRRWPSSRCSSWWPSCWSASR